MNPEKNPQINIQEKMQNVNDISFEEVPQGTSGAIEIGAYKEDSQEIVLQKLKEKLVQKNWWFQERWKKEGLPKEQFTISIGDKKLELFNFNKKLEQQEIIEIQEAVASYCNLNQSINFEFPKYLLFSNTEPVNSQSQEPFYGINSKETKSITIYPRAVNVSPYRVEEISNLKGTLTHELGHNLVDKIEPKEWVEKFGWESINHEEYCTWSKEKQESRPLMQETKFPERCITEYAQVDYTEDICESIVGYVADAPDLDPEKKEFLNNIFIKGEEKASISKNEKVVLPELPTNVKYFKKEEQRIKISFIRK